MSHAEPGPPGRPAGALHRGLLPLLLSAAACVLFSLFCIGAAPALQYEDAVHYVSLGEQLALGNGYHSAQLRFPDLMQPPLYPLLIAAVARLGGGALPAATAVCIAAQVLTLLALLRAHAALWGARGRGLSAAVAAVYPNVAFGAALVLEPIFLCLLAWAGCLGLDAVRRRSAGRAAGAGLLLGLALLTRPEVVITGAVLGGLVLLWPASFGLRARCLLALVATAALVVLPYGLWMRARLGVFDVVPKVRYNLAYADVLGHLAWEPGQEALGGREQRVYFALMPDRSTFIMNHAFEHPGFDPRPLFPRHEAEDPAGRRNALRGMAAVLKDAVLGCGAFHPLALGLLLLGCWRGLRGEDRERRLVTAALGGLVLLHLLPALASWMDYGSRFLGASLLFSVPLVAGGTEELVDRVAARAPRLRWAAQVCAFGALLGAYGVLSARYATTSLGGASVRQRAAALERACARHIPEGARVLAEHSRYAFLRRARAYQLPYARSLDDLVGYTAHHRIDYALLDARTLARNPSAVDRGLADPRGWPAGWVAIERVFGEGPGSDGPIWIVRLPPPAQPAAR